MGDYCVVEVYFDHPLSLLEKRECKVVLCYYIRPPPSLLFWGKVTWAQDWGGIYFLGP